MRRVLQQYTWVIIKNTVFSRYVLAEHCSDIRDIAHDVVFLHVVIVLYIYEVYLPIDFAFVLFFTCPVSINIMRHRHVRIRRAEHNILQYTPCVDATLLPMDATCTRLSVTIFSLASFRPISMLSGLGVIIK